MLSSKCPSMLSSSDVDECVTNNHDCDDNAMCINTVGGFHCTCNMGYTGVGTEGNCTSKVSAFQNLNTSSSYPSTTDEPNISSAVDHFA